MSLATPYGTSRLLALIALVFTLTGCKKYEPECSDVLLDKSTEPLASAWTERGLVLPKEAQICGDSDLKSDRGFSFIETTTKSADVQAREIADGFRKAGFTDEASKDPLPPVPGGVDVRLRRGDEILIFNVYPVVSLQRKVTPGLWGTFAIGRDRRGASAASASAAPSASVPSP